MESFPKIERTEDGWRRQQWRARVAAPIPEDLHGLGQSLAKMAFASLLEAWSDRGENRRDPIRVTCLAGGHGELDVIVEVQSEHPDWCMGALVGRSGVDSTPQAPGLHPQ